MLQPGLHKGAWAADEDRIVREMVTKHGVGNIKWSEIAARLPGRLGKQIRERWVNHLDPNINKGEWTEEEDKALLAAHESMGNKWADIAKTLPGRTDNQIKNRWNSALRRELRKLNRLANKQRGAVAAAMKAATDAAAAVGGASDKEGDEQANPGVVSAPAAAVLKETPTTRTPPTPTERRPAATASTRLIRARRRLAAERICSPRS